VCQSKNEYSRLVRFGTLLILCTEDEAPSLGVLARRWNIFLKGPMDTNMSPGIPNELQNVPSRSRGGGLASLNKNCKTICSAAVFVGSSLLVYLFVPLSSARKHKIRMKTILLNRQHGGVLYLAI
jgi:hypothetical protein